MTTTEAATFLNASIASSSRIPGVMTNLTLSMVNRFPLNCSAIFHIFYPSQISINAFSFKCALPVGAACSIVGGQNNLILVQNAFPSGLPENSSIVIRIEGLVNSIYSNVTSSFKIYSYSDITNLYKIDKVEDGLTLQSVCNYPCATCSSLDSSICTSCVRDSFDLKL